MSDAKKAWEFADAQPLLPPDAVKILDHGYMRVIETWGSDERIIEAARMSTQKGFLGWGDFVACGVCSGTGRMFTEPGWPLAVSEGGLPGMPCTICNATGGTGKRGDEKLLAYLYENQHNTPFEFAGMVIEVQAPIFVVREWERHRTQSYNEASARYAPLPDLNYIPSVERLMMGGGHLTKQAGAVAGAEVLTEEKAREYQKMLSYTYDHAEQVYQSAMKMGVPKELARVHLPVGRYTKLRAHTCLRNWLAFLTLRSAPNAQWEIREYARVLHDFLQVAYPRTMALFDRGRP